MENAATTYLAMFDRVTRLEPQLRDTLKAARQTANQSIHTCYLNLRAHDDDDTTSSDGQWYEDWTKANRTAREFEQKLKDLIVGLLANSVAMQSNRLAQAENGVANEQSAAAFLRSLDLDEKSRAAVETYVVHRASLMTYQQERNAGNWRAQPPENIDHGVFDIVVPLIGEDRSAETLACKERFAILQQEQSQLYEQFEEQRKLLKAVVAEMDSSAEALDQANLTAARAVRGRLGAMPKTPYLRAIGRSAVDTCTAVTVLSRRVAVVKAHPETMGDASY